MAVVVAVDAATLPEPADSEVAVGLLADASRLIYGATKCQASSGLQLEPEALLGLGQPPKAQAEPMEETEVQLRS